MYHDVDFQSIDRLSAMLGVHGLANQKQITVSDLRDDPFVLLDETHCLSGAVVSFC